MEYRGIRIEPTAGEALTRFRVGRLYAGKAWHADNLTSDHEAQAVGVIREDATLGGTAKIITEGFIEHTGWSWTPGAAIYCGAAGVLTATVPASGWVRQIAVAHTATKIFVKPRELVGSAVPVAPSITRSFAYGDATPASIGTVPAGKTVAKVELTIQTAFNGSGAALTIGKADALTQLMTASQNDPAAAATYETHPNVTYADATEIFLAITPGGGASSGSGFIRITFLN